MKKKILIRRAYLIIYGVCIAFACLIAVAGGILYIRKAVTAGQYAGIIIAGIVVAALFCILTYQVLKIPYKEHMVMLEQFIQTGQYEGLKESEYQIYDRESEVWQHLDEILDKQNLIRLSTKHAELLALQNQINPHFLYNTLEAIRGDALCEGMDEIADTTEALSTFFRYTISDTGNLVTLEDELENIENYFKVQKYRFGDRLCLKVDFPEDYAKVLQCRLPKLTLQPIVENAVFHGLESKADGGLVLISIDSTQSKLLLSIQDDGVGIPEKELQRLNEHLEKPEVKAAEKKKGGIALTNVSRRVKLLFGEEYGLHIFSVQDVGTEVQVTVPLICEDRDSGKCNCM